MTNGLVCRPYITINSVCSRDWSTSEKGKTWSQKRRHYTHSVPTPGGFKQPFYFNLNVHGPGTVLPNRLRSPYYPDPYLGPSNPSSLTPVPVTYLFGPLDSTFPPPFPGTFRDHVSHAVVVPSPFPDVPPGSHRPSTLVLTSLPLSVTLYLLLSFPTSTLLSPCLPLLFFGLSVCTCVHYSVSLVPRLPFTQVRLPLWRLLLVTCLGPVDVYWGFSPRIQIRFAWTKPTISQF